MALRAKKSLGQHFLTAPGIISAIVESADLHDGDTVVEIGPGRGALTKQLLKAPIHRLIAIEKDESLVEELTITFAEEISSGRLVLHQQDALDYIPEKGSLYKIVANIPYNITGLLLRYYLGNTAQQPTSMTLVVQKEIAERIARDQKESLLSLSVKAYGAPRYIKTITPRAFRPKPRVDSAILGIHQISRKLFVSPEHERLFFEVIKTAFRHKRKQLGKNMQGLALFDLSTIQNALSRVSIDPRSRAENISLEQWLDFVDKLIAHA